MAFLKIFSIFLKKTLDKVKNISDYRKHNRKVVMNKDNKKELIDGDLTHEYRTIVREYMSQGGQAFNPYKLGVEEKFGKGIWSVFSDAMFIKIIKRCYDTRNEPEFRTSLKNFVELNFKGLQPKLVELFKDVEVACGWKKDIFSVRLTQDIIQDGAIQNAGIYVEFKEKEGFSPRFKLSIISTEKNELHQEAVWHVEK